MGRESYQVFTFPFSPSSGNDGQVRDRWILLPERFPLDSRIIE